MGYSFVKVTSYYKEYLKFYYANYPEIKNKLYQEQHEHLMRQEFAMSDYYQQNFQKFGVEAYEIVGNAMSLQSAWAKENNSSSLGKGLILQQLKKISPDVVFFQDSSLYNGSWIDYLRKEIPSIKKIIGFRCSPFPKDNAYLFKNFDFMIACSGEITEELNNYGIKTYEINHAFEPSLVPQIETDNIFPVFPLTFVGSIIEGTGFHSKRKELLEFIIDQDIDLRFFGNIPMQDHLLLKQLTYGLTSLLKKAKLHKIIDSVNILRKVDNLTSMPKSFKISKKFLNHSNPPVFGMEMYKLLNKSNISFNIHGDIASRDAANLRLFEATGAGSCLLTDWKENIEKFFKIDEEIVCYKTPAECVEKISWLIANPEKCKEIALKGQKRTLANHSYYQRVSVLNDIILKELKVYK